MGHGVGVVVGLLTCYFDDPGTNPAVAYRFSIKFCLKRTKTNKIVTGVVPFEKNDFASYLSALFNFLFLPIRLFMALRIRQDLRMLFSFETAATPATPNGRHFLTLDISLSTLLRIMTLRHTIHQVGWCVLWIRNTIFAREPTGQLLILHDKWFFETEQNKKTAPTCIY